ncbi:MAG: DUF2142 domain-containing protein [Nocardioides sp.]
MSLAIFQSGWLVAVAPFHAMDEFDHAYRATSVARGDWAPSHDLPANGRGFLVRTPADVVEAAEPACSALEYTLPDNCRATTAPDERGRVKVASAAATYFPAWYVIAGTSALPFDGDAALYALRVSNLLLCGLLILGALAFSIRRARSWWPFASVLVACTPALVQATAVSAPNGFGFAGGLLFWAAVLALIRDPASPTQPLVGVVTGATAVMVAHSTGVLWIALAALCLLPLLGPRLRTLVAVAATRRRVVATLVAVTGVAAAMAWYVLANGTNDPRGESLDLGPAPRSLYVRGPILWTAQSVATGIFRNQMAPLAVYAVGLVALLLLLFLALGRGGRRGRWTLILLCVVSLAVPLALQVASYDDIGRAWQGRYAFPLSSGVILVAGHVIDERISGGPALSMAVRATVAAIVSFLQVATLWDVVPATRLDIAEPFRLVSLILGAAAALFLFIALSALHRALPTSSEQP